MSEENYLNEINSCTERFKTLSDIFKTIKASTITVKGVIARSSDLTTEEKQELLQQLKTLETEQKDTEEKYFATQTKFGELLGLD